MLTKNNSAQKFNARYKPSRVNVGVDIELPDGAKLKIDLPFVAGVLADLSGKRADLQNIPEGHRSARGELEERKFLEIDNNNFNDRMKAIRPAVSFSVRNTLTGDGNLPVELTFDSMEDFSPERIAERFEPLRQLFEARKALSYLKDKASNTREIEKVIQHLLSNPHLAKALVSASKV